MNLNMKICYILSLNFGEFIKIRREFMFGSSCFGSSCFEFMFWEFKFILGVHVLSSCLGVNSWTWSS